MKKLRLLVTKKCSKNCEGCCNQDWNLDNLPIAKYFNYNKILITILEVLSVEEDWEKLFKKGR